MTRALAVSTTISLSVLISLTAPSVALSQTTRYGIVAPMNSPEGGEFESVRALGVGSVRFTVYWNETEPQDGIPDWVALDSFMTQARALGASVLLTVGERTPSWAGPCWDCPPNDYNKYGEFFEDVIRHIEANYGDVDVTYGVWNEPNLRSTDPEPNGGFLNDPNAEVYPVLFQQAAAARNRVSSNIRIAGPETSWHAVSTDWFAQVMNRIEPYMQAWDVVTVHWYPDGPLLAFYMNYILSQIGTREVWLSEAGAGGEICSSEYDSRDAVKHIIELFDFTAAAWPNWTRVFIYRLAREGGCESIIQSDLEPLAPYWWYRSYITARYPDCDGVIYQPPGAHYGHQRSTGSVTTGYAVPRGCEFTTQSNVPWVHVTSGASGVDGDTVQYIVEFNPLPTSRQATLTLGNGVVNITQDACPPGCPFMPGSPSVTLTVEAGAVGQQTFEGVDGQTISVVINSSSIGSCASGTLKVLKPNTTELMSAGSVCAGAILGPVLLPESGTYTIVVDPYGTTSGQVTLTLHDVIDVTGPIPYGVPFTAPLITPGKRAVWTFNGEEEQRVSAVVNASTMGNCALMYHSFRIVSTDGITTLGGTSNLCAGGIINPVVLPTTGTYTLIIDPYGSYTGDMTVTLNNIIDVTGTISFGQSVSAPLTTPGRRAVWTFAGDANQRVSAVVNASTMGNCALMYHSFRIVSADGTTTLGNTSNLCAGGIIEPVVLPTTGTHTLIIDPYGSYTGDMTVTLNNIIDVTGTISFGQSVSAPLTTPGRRAVWTFAGNANQRVSAVVNASTMGNCALIYHSFRIISTDGTTTLGNTSNLCAGGIIEPVVLPNTGTYTLIIDPYGSYTGEMTVTLNDIVDVTGPIIVNGPAVTGELTIPGRRGVWTFDGTNGMQVRAIVDSSSVAICSLMYHKFRILKPDGSPLISGSNLCTGAILGPSVLPTGTYSVIVDPYAAYTGEVTVRLISP